MCHNLTFDAAVTQMPFINPLVFYVIQAIFTKVRTDQFGAIEIILSIINMVYPDIQPRSRSTGPDGVKNSTRPARWRISNVAPAVLEAMPGQLPELCNRRIVMADVQMQRIQDGPIVDEAWRDRLPSLKDDFQVSARSRPPLFATFILGPLTYTGGQQELRLLGMHTSHWIWTDTSKYAGDDYERCHFYANDSREPGEEAAREHFERLSQFAIDCLRDAPGLILDRILPPHQRPAGQPPRGRMKAIDYWWQILFGLAWQHPSTILVAPQKVCLWATPNNPSPLSIDRQHANLFEIPGRQRVFPHSFYASLKHDVWRSAAEAIDVILRMTPARCAAEPTGSADQKADNCTKNVRRMPNETTEQPIIDALYQMGAIGLEGLQSLPRKQWPTGDRLAAKAIGRSCDGQFKTTLSHMVDLGWLDNGRNHGLGGGYFLTPSGLALATKRLKKQAS
jgi:hypothetical protein